MMAAPAGAPPDADVTPRRGNDFQRWFIYISETDLLGEGGYAKVLKALRVCDGSVQLAIGRLC